MRDIENKSIPNSIDTSKKKKFYPKCPIHLLIKKDPSIETRRIAGVQRSNREIPNTLKTGKYSEKMRNRAREIFFKGFQRIQPKRDLQDSPLLMSFWNSSALAFSILQTAILAKESDRQLSIYNRRYIDSLSKMYNAMAKSGKLSSAQLLAFKTSSDDSGLDLTNEQASATLEGYFEKKKTKGDEKINADDTTNRQA